MYGYLVKLGIVTERAGISGQPAQGWRFENSNPRRLLGIAMKVDYDRHMF